MNLDKKNLIRVFGETLIFMALLMIPSLIIAIKNNNETMIRGFLYPITSYLFAGGCIRRFFPKQHKRRYNIRHVYMLLFLIIATSCISGAVPYYIGISDASFINSIFESTAGLTTTSATVFYEPSMDQSLILWKALEHWVGGLGIIVFIISIIPLLGFGDQQIATAESHGTFLNKIAPRLSQIIRYIVITYLGLTLIALIYFAVGNIPLFDAFILALSTSSTAGILLHTEGISYYGSFYIEFGVSVLSVLSGLSFVLYIHLLKKNYSEIKKNIELRAFILIIAVSTVIIGLLLYKDGHANLWQSMEDSFFQVSSFATTSGFAISNYTLWNSPSIFILISLMIIGGCSASTTGSFKVMRLLIIWKLISRGFTKRIHPRVVKNVKVGDSIISAPMVSSVTTFAFMYFATILISTIILSLQNLDIESTFSAAIGVISNSGISFGSIGMDGNYAVFHPFLQVFLSFLMVVGRLGFMTVGIVFLPTFWNPHKVTSVKF